MQPERADSVLTPREVQVLKLIAAGLSTKQIASALSITFKTAASHRARIMDKLGIHEVAGLTRYAIRRGFIENPGNLAAVVEESMFERVKLTYSAYKRTMEAYSAFLRERETFGLGNPDGSTGARQLREAERSAHEEYHSALVALKRSLLSDHG